MPDTPRDVESRCQAARNLRDIGREGVLTRVLLIGGSFHYVHLDLRREPERIEVAGERYERIDDPETGVSLGAYVFEKGGPNV